MLRCGRLASSAVDARDACFASASVEHRERHWRRQRRHAPLVKEDSLERIGLGAGATARINREREAASGWCCSACGCGCSACGCGCSAATVHAQSMYACAIALQSSA